MTAGVETAAAEAQSAGPTPVANLTPFVLTRLDPGVPRPLQGRIGEWSLDTTLSYGNTFIMSDNVRSYLQARDERRALDVRDVAALDAAGQDYYYLDVNVTRMTLEASMRVTSRLAGFVRVPIIHSGGGRIDSVIEGFHDVFGFDSAGRDLVARDGFQAIARIGDDRVRQLDPGSGTHVGDPVFGARYEVGDWLGWTWQWAAALKPSLRPARIIVANGATDASVQVAARRRFAGGVLWLAADNVWAGGSELFPSAHRASIPGLQAIYERRVSQNTEVLLQANASASTIDAGSNDLAALSEPEYQFTIGLRRQTPSATYALAFTENISNLDNSSDVGMHFSVAWRFDAVHSLLSLIEPIGSHSTKLARR
ncbi:MAG: DUF3187 family protein [Dehalococcoidia bacterium]